MEKFVGIQLVEAEPMTALEASKLGYYKGNPASDGELNEMQGFMFIIWLMVIMFGDLNKYLNVFLRVFLIMLFLLM